MVVAGGFEPMYEIGFFSEWFEILKGINIVKRRGNFFLRTTIETSLNLQICYSINEY